MRRRIGPQVSIWGNSLGIDPKLSSAVRRPYDEINLQRQGGIVAALRVLVVDDHPVNRLVLQELLSHLGCAVSVVKNGDEAVAMASGGHFDLICLDRNMPGLSGDEVAERLPADQFVLAWSTDLTDLPKRFNGTLSKPVTIPAVQAALARTEAWRASAMMRRALRLHARSTPPSRRSA